MSTCDASRAFAFRGVWTVCRGGQRARVCATAAQGICETVSNAQWRNGLRTSRTKTDHRHVSLSREIAARTGDALHSSANHCARGLAACGRAVDDQAFECRALGCRGRRRSESDRASRNLRKDVRQTLRSMSRNCTL
eukprot:3342539-Prymnesium_polylepis.1